MSWWYAQGRLTYRQLGHSASEWLLWLCEDDDTESILLLAAAVAKLWQTAGVPGAVCRVDVDSQFDKYVDRSTPCEPICCVNISNSVWSLVLRSSVNWLTIALQISAFPTLISSPGTLYSILSCCYSHYSPSPFISPPDYTGTTDNSRYSSLKSVARGGKQRSDRRFSSSPLVGVHAL